MSKQPLYPHIPKSKKKPTRDDVEIYTWSERDRLHIEIRDKRNDKTVTEWWDDDARQMFEDGFFKPGMERHQGIEGREFEESVLKYAEDMGILAGGATTTSGHYSGPSKLFQRGADGYPVGADKVLRGAYGPIPNPDQPFWSKAGFVKPATVYGWQWAPDYNRWRAYVKFPSGEETWTSPRSYET